MVEETIEFSNKNVFVGKTLRIFISYSHHDKRIAGAIKEAFNHYGMEAFLAHEDIQVGQEWRITILRNLKQFDVFISVLSKNFMGSEWTNQEVGFAICKETPIIPVSIDGTLPHGFLEMFQALTKFEYREYPKSYHSEEMVLDCKEGVLDIINIIATKEELKENLKDSLVKSIRNMRSYANAEKHMEILNSLKPFSKEQINEIINQSIQNNQVHNANRCKYILREFIKEHDNDIDNELKVKLLELINL